ncbi:MAG: 2-oxo acid dehydrogenase subunit E2 [Propionibacteriaceae bacterium]|jgi:pyruvate dehydrogenase E2 component (dihydrolipoamide acetyltransferase)|nr:2-oxo acid dehydrogenase subunit E2 [Propionibacteriaceae bacterium]
MADVVVMPQLGNTVESCLVTAWQVGVGDTVEPDTVVAEIETDKSSMEVPSGQAGTILALLAQAGDEVPVKAPFFIIGAPGESIEGLVPGPSAPSPDAGPKTEPSDEPAAHGAAGLIPQAVLGNQAMSAPSAPLSPRARRLVNETGLDASGLTGSGPGGRVVAADISEALAAAPAQPLSLPARSVEPEAPVIVTGTGLGGRVTRHDAASTGLAQSVPMTEGSAARSVSPDPQPTPASAEVSSKRIGEDTFPGTFTDEPLKGVRKLVAGRMLASMATHAQLTFDASAPAAGLLALRARFKTADPQWGMSAITIGDLVAYAAVQALRRHPSVNATLTDAVLRTYDHVHLGLAVDTPRGLLVPTIQYASCLGLVDLSQQSKLLAAAATKGDISPDLLTGGTFTVTNLGAYGIESFTPILNSPQVGILGVNAIAPSVCANPDGSVGVEQRISFSLTVDHAVVDGADAARYLKTLCALIADIDLTVMRGSHA